MTKAKMETIVKPPTGKTGVLRVAAKINGTQNQIRKVTAETFYQCKSDRSVSVQLVDGALLVVHAPRQGSGEKASGATALGYLTCRSRRHSGVAFLLSRFPAGLPVAKIQREVTDWWLAMPQDHRQALKLRFHNRPDITW